ncbi:TetR/AcrR family transcriptional regulator [Curtobacterium sp. VKM Ac-2887]|uniref:TetR/AcrR family transcriptional regulator n=1 Tax=Curtobacterium sp. VKM Ac-2887 TaxID=2783819 RepID=UPI00188CC2EE|nr:TetR/AcrR family transcriptional regulator [Curtobacterium sp. VKM Ac-2887]MBF4585719.1 TetR family transcriptional regulator [Curtobacterium sp. VKM Ac-2887]
MHTKIIRHADALVQVCLGEHSRLRHDWQVIHSDGTAATPGLRDVKRRETRDALAEAALFFTLRDGLEAATIDHIAERAHVSRRTFFNYFDSKEDALLVTNGFELDESMLAEHAARYEDADLIDSIVGLLFVIAAPAISDVARSQQRGEVIKRYPQLVTKQFALMNRVGTEVLKTVRGMIESRRGECPPGTAEMLVSLCYRSLQMTTGAVMAGSAEPDLPELERQCSTLVRRTLDIAR